MLGHVIGRREPGSDPAPDDCALGRRAPCPEECGRAGRCVVIRIRHADGSERWGVPLAVVGETLRFRQSFPRPDIILLPLDGLEPASAGEAVREAREWAGRSAGP